MKSREPRGGPTSVLVADDDDGVRGLIAAILSRLGWTSECCGDGREAFVKAARGLYSLVILDCRMPLMTGPEVARELRKRGQSVPVILMSAGDQGELAAILGDIPGVTLLSKPFGLDEFHAALEEACAWAGPGSEEGRP